MYLCRHTKLYLYWVCLECFLAKCQKKYISHYIIYIVTRPRSKDVTYLDAYFCVNAGLVLCIVLISFVSAFNFGFDFGF